MTDRAGWNLRVKAGLRFFLVTFFAQVVAAVTLLPACARFLAPLGFLVPGRGPRAAVVSFLLDVPLFVAAAGAAWVLGRIGEGPAGRRAAVLVALLWLFDACSGLFVNQNFDRWLDVWSVTARALGMLATWALARRVLRHQEALRSSPARPREPPTPAAD